jgi:hypothetical protein
MRRKQYPPQALKGLSEIILSTDTTGPISPSAPPNYFNAQPNFHFASISIFQPALSGVLNESAVARSFASRRAEGIIPPRDRRIP